MSKIGDYNASLTQDQRREAARRAGIASARAKKERRAMAETLEMLLKTPIHDGTILSITGASSLEKAKDMNCTAQDVMLANLVNIACSGGKVVKSKSKTIVTKSSGASMETLVESPKVFVTASESMKAVELIRAILGEESSSDTSPLDALAAAIKERS